MEPIESGLARGSSSANRLNHLSTGSLLVFLDTCLADGRSGSLEDDTAASSNVDVSPNNWLGRYDDALSVDGQDAPGTRVDCKDKVEIWSLINAGQYYLCDNDYMNCPEFLAFTEVYGIIWMNGLKGVVPRKMRRNCTTKDIPKYVMLLNVLGA